MNVSRVIAQVISKPKLVRLNKQNIVYMMLAVPNDKKNISFLKVYAYGHINYSYQYDQLYKKKDIIFLTGYLYIKKKLNSTSHQSYCPILEFNDIQLYLNDT